MGGKDFYLDLLFYHLRLRCFVVIDLKIEEFEPEFAGKMNFYLSAVDDQLRHANDNPSIGIILCKGRNEVIVEYALRDSTKPMGVAGYSLSGALPHRLQSELPTPAELAREFPNMELVRLRIEIERALRVLLERFGIDSSRPAGIDRSLRELKSRGVSIEGAPDFLNAVTAMNAAAHGSNVDSLVADEARQIGSAFLAELKRAISDE